MEGLQIIEFIPNLRKHGRQRAHFVVALWSECGPTLLSGVLLAGSGGSVYAKPTAPTYGTLPNGSPYPVVARWPDEIEERIQEEAARFWRAVS